MSLVHTLLVGITSLIASIPINDLEYVRTLTTRIIDGVALSTNPYSQYNKNDDFPPQETPEEFDFVIVGASPSGSVIANRLSEISEWNVLLLEAGGVPSILERVPLGAVALYPSVYNWGTLAERQTSFCTGCLNNKRLNYGHGKGLGGGSIINYMAYTRGNQMDYDNWEAMGNPGWSFKDLLPYFLKIEDASVAIHDTGYRAKGGPLGVSDLPFTTKLTDVFVHAAQEAEYPYVDYNGRQQIGVSYMQATMRDGLRSDAENSYLRSVRHRKNLKIRTNAYVTKILIKPESKEAYAVEYEKNGKTYVVLARKEVILSAGGLHSPMILMLSGIGPKRHLEEIGIPVIKHLPVGKIMYDHVTFLGVQFMINQSIGLDPLTPKYILDPNMYVDFILYRKGLITSTGMEALAYLKTNLTEQMYPTWPDIELLFVAGSVPFDFGIFFRPVFNINDGIYNSYWKPLIGKPMFTVLPVLVQPLSKGYIKLSSKNPFEPAKYTVNYFSDPENLDIKRIIVAIREIQRIVNQPALRKYDAKMPETRFPGCDNFTFDSDEYWECAIRAIPGSLYHQQSACRMGPKTDKSSVVDARLRVHGIKKLRVADTSIIPRPISGHTVSPAYMIGEKAADMVKGDWQATSTRNQ